MEIDPGEIIIAVLGVRRTIERKHRRMTQAEIGLIGDFSLKLSRLAMKLCNGTLPEKDELPPTEYYKLLDDLSIPFDEGVIEDVLNSMPRNAEAQMSALAVSKKIYDLLSIVLPKSVYQSMTSSVNLAISAPQWWEFQEAFELLDKPLTVFNDIATGEILPSQVTCMRECYPTVSGAIDGAIRNATATALGRDKNFELPEHTEFGVANWFKSPIDVAPYQQAYTTLSSSRNVSPSPSTSQESPESASSMTAAQNAALKPVSGKSSL